MGNLCFSSVPGVFSPSILREKRIFSDIVRRLNTTAGTLERLFRSHLGTTPRAYLTGLRMQTAAELLRNSTLRIGQIAERVGYGDPLAFSHAFRRVHGTSPRAFRKSQQTLPPARDA